ncbi:MAG: glycosyl transferase family 1 [Chloroflexi bacterium]|nr:MAG: glycosyl transferase family 1 [Chloroflexota bacterium]
MRILFLTQVLPYPLDAGPKVRAYYVLRHLASRHSVTLVSFVRPTDTRAAVEHLRSFCHEVHTVTMTRSALRNGWFFAKSLATGQPFIIERDWTTGMARQVRQLVGADGRFDAIHADQLWMAPYALWAQQVANGASPSLTLDQHNAVFMIPQRMADNERHMLKRAALTLEARKLRDYEIETCRRFDRVIWVTREDYDALQDQTPTNSSVPNSGVIPICGDPEGVAPVIRTPGGRRVTFVGGLHYPPNAQGILWFAKQVFPQVLAQQPDTVLTVIGKQPPPELADLPIPPSNLEVTGYVDDPQPYLAETGAFVVPLLAGGGMRVKIVEGWTWGMPMVSTTVGAEGIRVRPGENLLVADTPEAFAEATVCLLRNQAMADQLAQHGRAWVLEHYNWRTTYRQWDAIYP